MPRGVPAGQLTLQVLAKGEGFSVTPAVSGIPTASERGEKSELAHLWAKWLCHPCRLGDPHRFTAGGGNQNWPTSGQKDYVTPAVSGIPTAAERGGQNQKWPTSGQSGYGTPAVSGIPTATERGGKIRIGPQVGKVALSPLPSRGSPPERGGKSEVAHLWAKWLRHPCRLGDPHRFRAGGQNQKWPTSGQSGYVTPAVSGIPTRAGGGGGGDQNWPTNGQSGYVTRAVSGIPTRVGGGGIRSGPPVGKVALSPLPSRGSPPERGGKSEVAHLWAKWLRHPCRLGDPHRLRAGGQNQKWPTCGQSGYVTPAVSGIPTKARGGIRIGPQMGKVATSLLLSRGSPLLQSGGQNQKWPTCGQSGYVTPAVLGIPTASERGGKIRSGPQVGKVATSPLPSRGSPPEWGGGEIRIGPPVGKVATSPLPSRGSPPKRGGKSEVAHLWAKWLRHCRLGDPHRFRAGDKIRSGPQMGKVATSPLPSWGSPPLQSGGAKSKVAHKWAKWLRHPRRLGDPHRFRAGGKIRKGPQVGMVATSLLPSRGSPPLHIFFLLSFLLSKEKIFFSTKCFIE